MARKHLLDELTAVNTGKVPKEQANLSKAPRVTSQAVGAVSQSFEKLKAGNVIEIEPDLIDGPLVSDRLEIQGENLEKLITQIKEHGQQLPILVRPHPEDKGRYQIAYGWRRTAAAKSLNIKVKAMIKKLSDEELVIAQGQENNERQDLSYIEKAQYAANLEDSGFARTVITACLAIDKSECSRLISTYRNLPSELVAAIGPAEKSGRGRWADLANLIKMNKSGVSFDSLSMSREFKSLDSDARFEKVFKDLSPTKAKKSKSDFWKTDTGIKIAKIDESDKKVTLSFDQENAPLFGRFVLKALPELYAQYLDQKDE